MYRITKIWVSPVMTTTPDEVPGFYANTRLEEDGWWVQHYGETEELAQSNLVDYIQSGKFDHDRGR